MELRSACLISRALMDHWAKEVKTIEEKSKVLAATNPVMFEPLESYLMVKYVDDVLKVLEAMRRGTRWNHLQQAFIWTQEAHEEDEGKTSEEITMSAVQEMSSSIMKCLNFTWDSPGKNPNNGMPVLDTTMWVGIPERKWGLPDCILREGTQLPEILGEVRPIILHCFYRKSMANRTPLHHRAAVPEKDRVRTVSNEFARR